MNLNDLRMSLKAALDSMWSRIDARITAIEEGGGGGGVTGVKGDAESAYRQGNVNLTPANIGAVAKTGDTMTGDLTIEQAMARTYLNLTSASDKPADVRFSNANAPKWALTSRSSSDSNFFGLYNHMVNSYAVRVENDNTVSLLKPLPVGSGGNGATTPDGARTNLEAAKQQATDWYTMFDTGFGSSTGQSLSSYQGRRFTQWGISDPMLVTTIVAGGWVRQTIMAPLSTFQQYPLTFAFPVAGVSKYVDIRYASDTGILVDSDTTGTIKMYILYNS